jgi:uncharacterized protein YbjT (DUF2867 family)
VRTAARTGAEVHFDWNDAATFEPAVRGASGVYVVSPMLRADFAGVVSRFLDKAERAGVRPNGDVLAVTGTQPVSFAEFAAETAPAWK